MDSIDRVRGLYAHARMMYAERKLLQEQANALRQQADGLAVTSQRLYEDEIELISSELFENPMETENGTFVPKLINISETQLLLAIDGDKILQLSGPEGQQWAEHVYSKPNRLGVRTCLTCTSRHEIVYDSVNVATSSGNSPRPQRGSRAAPATQPELPLDSPSTE